MTKFIPLILPLILIFHISAFGQYPVDKYKNKTAFYKDTVAYLPQKPVMAQWVKVSDTVRVETYFQYMDSVVAIYDSLKTIGIDEHTIVHCNRWLIDTLSQTDYYIKKAKDSFVYDQKKMIVFRTGDSLLIPGKKEVDSLKKVFSGLRIDINIPEYKLRIFSKDSVLFEFLVRVGQNRKRYLAMSKRITNLRTQKGSGAIVAHHKQPTYYNPVTMKRYRQTRRDDGKLTSLPQIPWLETAINGVKNGQMIHPTTNPETLGKAYSNGCIGTGESDAWVIYYYAPIGTPVTIRYDLLIKDKNNKAIELEDIYYNP